MARRFNSAESEYLLSAATTPPPVPMTLAMWFNIRAAGDGAIACVTSTANTRVMLNCATAVVNAQTVATGGGTGTASTTATYSFGVWNHAVGVIAATNSRSAYLNGGNKVTNTTNITLGTVTRYLVGARYSSSVLGAYSNGLIADFAVWNVALTDEEVALVYYNGARGIDARSVRSDALAFHAPLTGRFPIEQDMVNGDNLAVNGPIYADHPIQFRPGRRPIWDVPAAAVGGALPWVYRNHTHTLGAGFVVGAV
jgi:hypothetical protein